MKTIILSVAVFGFLLFNATAQQSDYTQLRNAAENEYQQRSYARAHEIYARVDKSKLAATELRWIEFRLADTAWRAEAATQTSDNSEQEAAQKQLEELIRVADKDVDRDLVWAEAHESLGDMFWIRRNQMNWGAAWPHYHLALDWWAGQRDIERARTRYLALIFKATSPSVELPIWYATQSEYYVYPNYGNVIPINILENALKISTTPDDRSHLNYLIAMGMRQSGTLNGRDQVPDYFEEALKAGKRSAWYDDALFHYAEWMNSQGVVYQTAEGAWQPQPDYVKALELFRRLTTEFSAGETRYFKQATHYIITITTPDIRLGVANIFLPGSEIQFALNVRNAKHLELRGLQVRPDARSTVCRYGRQR